MAKQIKLLKNLSTIALIVVITLMPAVSVIGQESITLTTIMPGQDTLRVKRGAVGVNYKDSINYPDTGIGGIGDDNLIIEGNVGIGTPTPGAALEVSSTSSGFLPPRMTTDQRDAISNPPTGSVIYNIDSGFEGLNHYDGSEWKPADAVPLTGVAFCLGTYGWGFMVATVPSTGKVYLRALETQGEPTYFPDPAYWTNWVDFGAPDTTSEITGISGTMTYALGHLWGYITASMSDGTVYMRALIEEGEGYNIDDPSVWTTWTSFGNPG